MRPTGLLVTAAATALLTASLLSGGAPAQSPSEAPPAAAAMQPGDMAVTGFSGTILAAEKIPPGVDPVDRTFIDPNGPALRIFDVSNLGGAPAGQLVAPPVRLEAPAKDIGQVFGLVFDDGVAGGPPNLYAAATSAFGLNIVGSSRAADGKPARLKAGAPDAAFMEGQFGALSSGSPSAIYKIDGTTGAVSYVADTAFSGGANTGPGIGGLAYDAASRNLYASDLDTGIIHRFGLDFNNADLSQYDHGVAGRRAKTLDPVADDGRRLQLTDPAFKPDDPATWGFTQPQRRVDALAVHDGRLFYAVADGPEIWSVGLNAGGFLGDARLEMKVKAEKPYPITGIAFDGNGRMLLAQRGPLKSPYDYSSFVTGGGEVLRYAPEQPDDPATPDLWAPEPATYAVGTSDDGRAADGSVSLQYGYKPDGSLDTSACAATVVMTGDTLTATAHGVQLEGSDLVRPANVPPKESAYINWAQTLDDPTARGYAGGIAVFHTCAGGSGTGFPLVAGDDTGVGGGFPPVVGDPGGVALPPVVGAGTPVLPPDEGGGGGGGVTTPPDVGGSGGKVQDLQVTKTAGVTTCSPKGGCVFNIEVRNPGATEIAGPIVIDEQIDAPQATLTGEPNVPWVCTKAAPFTCTHPGPVPANGKLEDMRVVFATNTAPEVKQLKNCALVKGAAAPAGAAPAAGQCATIALDPNAPVQTGPVITSKFAASTCFATGVCSFVINVTNNSDAEVKGPIVLDEQIDAPQAALAGEPNAPWTCTKVPPVTCTHPGPIAAKEELQLRLAFTPNTPPEKTQLKNCAIVKQPAPAAPAGPAAPPKQIAPGKKSEAPLGNNPLLKLASFRPQVSTHQTLIHKVGGTGNIGGVTNKCLKWGPPPAFSVQQADGTAITFDNVSIDPAGNLGGNARIFSGRKGTIDGTFNGSLLSFRLRWSDGTIGDYTARVDADGMIAGLARDIAGGPNVKFNGLQPWKCGLNEICDKYTKAAADAAKTFNQLACGPDEPPGRWSNDTNFHLNWCMGQPPNSTFLNSETEARSQGLAACQAERATVCDAYVANALVLAKDFEARKCTEPDSGYLSTDAEAQRKFCLEQSRGNLDSTAQSRKILLDTCIARQAAAGGAGAPANVPPAGPPPAPGPAPAPAPEQCAVVDIQPGTQPPVQVKDGVPALAANGLEITKAFGKQAPCTNDLCPFVITVKNTNATAVPGPIRVVDFIGGGVDEIVGVDTKNSAIISGPKAPWTCVNRPPEQTNGILCTHPGPIAAGETTTIELGIKLAGPPTIRAVFNLAVLVPKTAEEKQASSSAIGPIQPPPAQGPVGPATAANGLQINKVVAPGAPCTNANCAFTITVKNTNATPMPGPIKVVDLAQPELPGGQIGPITTGKIVSGPTAPWTCAKRPPQNIDFECTHPGPLAAGETSTINMAIAFDAGVILDKIKNCGILDDNAFVCADAPIAQVQQPVPPAPPAAKTLVLTKNPVAEKCSDIGGGCDFVVSITNTGDTDFTNPIAFTDVLSTGDGKPLPNAEFGDFGSVSGTGGPDINAPFVCKKGGGVLTCSTGAAPVRIPPKRTITFPMSIKPGPAGGATAVKNCAQILLDQFAEPVCRTMPLINGPLLRATKLTAATSCNPECFFSVRILNVGNADAVFPFTFTDRFTPATKIIPIFTQGGDFTCRLATEQGNGVAVCNGNKQRLAPGEQMLGKIAIMGVPLAREYTNCIEISPAGGPVDTTFPGRCVTIKEPQPERANLAVRKRPEVAVGPNPKAGECKIEGPCKFVIEVVNTGNTTYNGPIKVTDEVPENLSIGDGVKVQSAPAGIEGITSGNWNCTKPSTRAISCTHKQTTLVPGEQVILDVVITPGPSWKKNDAVTNCASVATPVGNDGGSRKDDDTDCAIVNLDPFSVKVSKTGDQVCLPGSDCNFTIKLFNPGPIDHNAPVTISDKLTGLSSAQIVSISPPLPCAAQPTQIPFSCTSPGPVRLDLDAKPGDPFGPQEFVMVVRLPNDASADKFSNCASVAGDTSAAAAEEACHTVSTKPAAQTAPSTTTCTGGQVMTARGCVCPAPTKLKGSECVGAGGINTTPQTPPPAAPPPPVVTAPAPPSCSGGMILIEGSCACPAPTKLKGGECVGAGGINTTPQTPPPAAPQPPVVTAPAAPSCSGGLILIEGSCACPALTEWNGRNCVPTSIRPPVVTAPAPLSCSGGMILIEGSCACPPAMTWSRSKCVGTGGTNTTPAAPQPAPPPKPQPPKKTTTEECPENSRFRNGACQCRPGFEPSRRGRECRRIQQAPPPGPPKKTTTEECPENSRFRNGACECLPGFEPRRRECRPVQQAPQRPQQQRPFEKTCPDGTKVFGQFTQCPNDKPQLPQKPQSCPRKTPNGTFPNCCPRQMQFRNGQCVDDKCRQGMVGTPPNCACPPGTRFENDRCRVPAGPAPQPAPSPQQPQQPKCGPGFSVVNGQCVCLGKKEVIRGQCVDTIQ